MNIQCKFGHNSNDQYMCLVNGAEITLRGDIRAFKGEHDAEKCNKDVESLSFADSTVYVLPNGLSKCFSHLRECTVLKCGLKQISAKNLQGLEYLESLWLDNNDLSSLPNDLFIHTTNLKSISFNGNKLEFVNSRLLDPISDDQLEFADFRDNTKINAYFWLGNDDDENADDTSKSLDELRNLIDASCLPPTPTQESQSILSNYKKLWDLKKFYDFTIVAGGKKIRVHKNVLSVQSPVFASMFESDEALSKLEIKDYDENVVEQFLHSLYTAELGNEEHAMAMFDLATKFKIGELINLHEAVIVKNLNEQNVAKALAIGNLHKSDAISGAAFNMIQKMFPDEVQSEALKYKPEHIEEIIRFKRAIKVWNVNELNAEPDETVISSEPR